MGSLRFKDKYVQSFSRKMSNERSQIKEADYENCGNRLSGTLFLFHVHTTVTIFPLNLSISDMT